MDHLPSETVTIAAGDHKLFFKHQRLDEDSAVGPCKCSWLDFWDGDRLNDSPLSNRDDLVEVSLLHPF